MLLAKKFWVVPVTLYVYRYGHQDNKVISKRIEDILKGIKDNLEITIKNDFELLYEKIIERINIVYYDSIMSGLSDEIMTLLLEINRLNQQYSKSIPIKPLEDIFSYYEPYKNLQLSYSVMHKIVKIQQSKTEFRRYFEVNRISKVVVYGLGVYGKILLNIIEKSGVKVVCCIDKKVEEYEKMIVIKPEDDIPECDALIISLLDPNEIKKCYVEKVKKVITFREIVDDIVDQLEKFS